VHIPELARHPKRDQVLESHPLQLGQGSRLHKKGVGQSFEKKLAHRQRGFRFVANGRSRQPQEGRIAAAQNGSMGRGEGRKEDSLVLAVHHCGHCAVNRATERLIDALVVPRQTANTPETQLKPANKQRQNALAQHASKPSDKPVWLTETFVVDKIQPLLASLSALVKGVLDDLPGQPRGVFVTRTG
jgi:hypothetical protein